MRTMIRMTMAILLFSLFSKAAAFPPPAAEGSCPLSTFKNGEAVSIHGRIADGAHDMLLALPGCDKVVVLEYAGGPETGESGDDLTGEICTRWNEREFTWRKSGSCQSRGTSQSKS
jgi:hypothetical protein